MTDSPYAQRRDRPVLMGLLVAFAAAALLLPGISSLPPIDRDESRFAEATRHMVASGELVVPRVEGKPRLNKPPLIYWLQAAAVSLVDPNGSIEYGGIWAYRIPSALAAMGAMLLVWRLGAAMFAPQVGIWAALLLGGSMVLMVDSRQARADQVLLLSICIAQFALWRIWSTAIRGRRAGIGSAAVFWLAMGAGILTKGPVAPATVGMTAVLLSLSTGNWRWLGQLRLLSGCVLLVAMLTPWVWLAAREVGWGYLREQVYQEVFVRATSAKEGHGAWPGFYAVLLPVLFWPGSLTLIPLVMHAWRRGVPWRGRTPRRAELFCLAWLLPGWLMFELAGTKLPHYILPVFPPLALLAARALFAVKQGWQWVLSTYVGKISLWGWLALTQAVGVGPLIVLAWLGRIETRPEIMVALVVVILLGLGLAVATIFAAGQRQWRLAQGLALVLACVMHGGAYSLVLPNLERLWLSSRIAVEIEQVDPDGERPLASAGYGEESLVFLTQGRLRRLSWRELTEWLEQHPDSLIVVGEYELEFLIRRMPDMVELPPYRRLASVQGFNYANGRPQRLALVELDVEPAYEPVSRRTEAADSVKTPREASDG